MTPEEEVKTFYRPKEDYRCWRDASGIPLKINGCIIPSSWTPAEVVMAIKEDRDIKRIKSLSIDGHFLEMETHRGEK